MAAAAGDGSPKSTRNALGTHLARLSSSDLRARPPLLGGTRHPSRGELLPDPEVPAALKALCTKVLDDAKMKARMADDELWARFVATRTTRGTLSKDDANAVATVLREWAQESGVATFSHWFSPVRGANPAEKLSAFVDLDYSNGNLIVNLSGAELFQSETDGSSFPNGGLRQTHAAAAYTAWDTSAPPFIFNKTLYVPAVFLAFTGEALDYRAPLLRSQAAINTHALRLLRHLGDDETTQVVTNVGWEQEFFIVDRELFLKRPDLVATGRALFGEIPSKGQELDRNYFARMSPRVRAVLDEMREKMWELGCSINCVHNEVAPGQHEFSPIFSLSHLATDSNVLAMEVLRETAYAHGLAVLFHEKPFAGINGSGKHNNWGLNTDTGGNVFVYGKTDDEQRRFGAFVAALARTIHLHGDLLRIGVSTAGNDHRLGAQEAPPAIISLYVGAGFEAFLRAAAAGGPLTGYDGAGTMVGDGAVPGVMTAAEDRNRTAPFPWCSNRFEFRAVGSDQQLGFPNTLLNAAMADSIAHMASEMDKEGADVDSVIRATLDAHKGAFFSGDGYDTPLIEGHARKEGLAHLRTSPEAYAQLDSEKNIALLTSMKVFTEREVRARRVLLEEAFVNHIDIEARCALSMLRQLIIPACVADVGKEQKIIIPGGNPLLDAKLKLLGSLVTDTEALQGLLDDAPDPAKDPSAAAVYAHETLRPALAATRESADALEVRVAASRWPLVSVSDLVHSHQ